MLEHIGSLSKLVTIKQLIAEIINNTYFFREPNSVLSMIKLTVDYKIHLDLNLVKV